MLYPTIDELTKGEFNRYELALATAKCARIITDEYVSQHEAATRSLTGNKETDRPLNTMIDRELRDEKAVKVAIGRLHAGRFEISLDGPFADEETVEETVEETAEEAVEAAAEEAVEAAADSTEETVEAADADGDTAPADAE